MFLHRPSGRRASIGIVLLCVALLTGALIGALVPTRPAGGQSPSQFDLLPDLLTARFSHQATALPDGRVLITGGTLQGESLNTAAAELFVPDAGVFRDAGAMSLPRSGHTATLLDDGTVLIAGGNSQPHQPIQTAERFDVARGTFVQAGPLRGPRALHTATLLDDGRVLIAGGISGGAGSELARAEIYDPARDSFRATGAMSVGRAGHSATRLPDGRVLIAGGDHPLAGGSAERFTPAPPPPRDVALLAGWNLIAWTGDETPVASALAALPAVRSVFAWDAAERRYLRYSRGVPASVNRLTVLRAGAGLWVLSERPAIWRMPGLGRERSVSLAPGFNLAGWTGPDGVALAEITRALGPAVVAVWVFDPLAQEFRAYRPAGPSRLNTASTINHGDGLWLLLESAVIWPQPAAGFR